MGKGGQLHELLAVEGDLKGEMQKIREETINTFNKKQGLFLGFIKRLEMLSEERQDEGTEERQALTETVSGKLKYITGSFSRYWDVRLQKECANQEARADVEIDGNKVFINMPVTFLLGMEEELKQLRKLYDSIPTLQPGVDWVVDEKEGENVYKTEHPVVKNKTEKVIEHKITVPATKEHPAQVVQWTEDKTIGKYNTITWSGMISPVKKSNMLNKIDKLIRAFKKARQRANTQETKPSHVGKEIFQYIND